MYLSIKGQKEELGEHSPGRKVGEQDGEVHCGSNQLKGNRGGARCGRGFKGGACPFGLLPTTRVNWGSKKDPGLGIGRHAQGGNSKYFSPLIT